MEWRKGLEIMHKKILNALVIASVAVPLTAVVAAEATKKAADQADQTAIERGKYLVRITGCNDCHTPGYALSGGKVPESQWLIGDKLGWRGPWGTTYPTNLRLYMRDMPEDKWVKTARTLQTRPPMPWFNLNAMTDQDLKAIYHYVRSLPPAGELAPAFVAPGKDPQGPVIQFPAPPK
jgi:mono/diheme cytochrome c family protein